VSQYGSSNNGNPKDGYRTEYATKGKPSLASMAKHNLWPTPTATLGSKGGWVTPRKSKHGGTLIEEVSARTVWPTASARDHKDTPGMARSSGDRDRTDQLPRKVYAVENTPAGGGTLNPTWVEWLMGFPPEWTVLDASEMPSSRKLRKNAVGA